MTENQIAKIIVNSAFRVHKELGPGLLENAYQECLFYELKQAGLFVEKEKPMPLIYKDVKLDIGYRLDLLVERKVIVELKSVQELTDVHLAQVITYLKLSGCKLGFLINFNVKYIKHGIKRVVYDLDEKQPRR